MQTFLPYPEFRLSAHCLDDKRLNKQVLECKQIHVAATSEDETVGWYNHPAVRMWRGYEHRLFLYSVAVHDEWMKRRAWDGSHAAFDDHLFLFTHWWDQNPGVSVLRPWAR